MANPFEREHADPATVTATSGRLRRGGVVLAPLNRPKVLSALTSPTMLAVTGRYVAFSLTGTAATTLIVARTKRLATLPPYFTVYVPPKTGGGDGGGSGGFLPVPARGLRLPGGTEPQFIGRSQDRKKRLT